MKTRLRFAAFCIAAAGLIGCGGGGAAPVPLAAPISSPSPSPAVSATPLALSTASFAVLPANSAASPVPVWSTQYTTFLITSNSPFALTSAGNFTSSTGANCFTIAANFGSVPPAEQLSGTMTLQALTSAPIGCVESITPLAAPGVTFYAIVASPASGPTPAPVMLPAPFSVPGVPAVLAVAPRTTPASPALIARGVPSVFTVTTDQLAALGLKFTVLSSMGSDCALTTTNLNAPLGTKITLNIAANPNAPANCYESLAYTITPGGAPFIISIYVP